MAISTVPVVVTIPAEGSPTFRQDAATAWNELKNFSSVLSTTIITQMNDSIENINAQEINVVDNSTLAKNYMDTTLSYKNEIETYRDEISAYAVSIDMNTIKAEITTFTDTKEQQIVDALNTTINNVYSETNRNIRRLKMQSFGIGLQL